MSTPLYFARREMTYGGQTTERQVDYGQVLELEGLVNDDRLVRADYVRPISTAVKLTPCTACDARFAFPEALPHHLAKRHAKAAAP